MVWRHFVCAAGALQHRAGRQATELHYAPSRQNRVDGLPELQSIPHHECKTFWLLNTGLILISVFCIHFLTSRRHDVTNMASLPVSAVEQADASARCEHAHGHGRRQRRFLPRHAWHGAPVVHVPGAAPTAAKVRKYMAIKVHVHLKLSMCS